MSFKIKTSKKTMEIFKEIEASERLQPFVLSKLAIAISLREDDPNFVLDFNTDNDGLELNRQTITGEYDSLFKALISVKEEKHIDDDTYFQKYVKAHLDRGAKMLYSEFRYKNDFLLGLIEEEKSI